MSCSTKDATDIREDVKEYYGETLQKNDDLQTNACNFSVGKMKKHISDAMKLVHPDVAGKSFGCGLTVPECLKGMSILDLGSGSGQDCFALSKLVGEKGFLTGVDMTDKMLETANKYIDYHMNAFGFQKPNVKFVKGYLENLGDAGIEDNSIDIVISNCVINLCKDKKSVLEQAFRVLKDGGELFFSDMYADRVVSESVKSNKILWGEGLGGALHWKQLFSIAAEIGFETPKTVSSSFIKIIKPDIRTFVGDTRYVAVGYRLFKLPQNTKRVPAEVRYKGGITGYEDSFQLDCSYRFCKDVSMTVDEDTAAILQYSRFQDVFETSKSEESCSPIQAKEIDPFEFAASQGNVGCGGMPCGDS